MTDYKAPYSYANTHDTQPPSEGWVLAWVYWLRAWLGLTCHIPLEDMELEYQDAGYKPWEYERPVYLDNRRRRRWVSHYRRCGNNAADARYVLRSLLPRGLSPTQMQERISRVSSQGRVRVYGLCFWGSVLLRRARRMSADGQSALPRCARYGAAFH